MACVIVKVVLLDFRSEGFSQLYVQHKVRMSRRKCLLLQHMPAYSILCSEHFMARQVEDALDQRTAELIALQKAAVEHAAASPLKSMPLQSALGAWASAAQGVNAAIAADSQAHRCANTSNKPICRHPVHDFQSAFQSTCRHACHPRCQAQPFGANLSYIVHLCAQGSRCDGDTNQQEQPWSCCGRFQLVSALVFTI